MKPQANRPQLDGRVRDVVASGDAVIETSSGVVFARGALPGERVRVRLDAKAGRVKRGRLAAVVEASPQRVEPPCKYAERCGGCSLMHAELEAQRALQRGFLENALRKAGADVSVKFTSSPEVLGYRARARLTFRRIKNSTLLGFHRGRSEALVDIDHCLVLTPILDAALTLLRERVIAELVGEGEIQLALGKDERAVVVIRCEAPQSPSLYRVAEALVPEFAGVALSIQGVQATFGDPREWSRAHDGLPLEGPIGGFSQANRAVNDALVARVAELAQTEGMRVLELYAGSGNFTVALAKAALSYGAVEQASDAVRALKQNLAARSLSVRVIEGDVARSLAGPALDVVVLDPPRTGAAGVLPALLPRKPKRIVYVSCDPATLARDVGEVLSRGYALRWAEAFEMFPQTADLESVIVLERENV